MTGTMIFCGGCLTGMGVSALGFWWFTRSLDNLNKW